MFEKLKFTSSDFPVVLFNASGTLLQYQMSFERFYKENLAKIGIERSEFEITQILESLIRELNDEIDKNGQISWKPMEGLRRFATSLQLTKEKTDELELSLKNNFHSQMKVAISHSTLDICTELRKRGYRLGILSNWNGPLADILRDYSALDLFDAVLTSYELGIAKPEKQAFEIALEDMDANASQAIFVGSSYAFDIFGARRAGLQPILYDPQMIEMKALHVEAIESKIISLETLRQHRRLQNIPVIIRFEELLKIFL